MNKHIISVIQIEKDRENNEEIKKKLKYKE